METCRREGGGMEEKSTDLAFPRMSPCTQVASFLPILSNPAQSPGQVCGGAWGGTFQLGGKYKESSGGSDLQGRMLTHPSPLPLERSRGQSDPRRNLPPDDSLVKNSHLGHPPLPSPSDLRHFSPKAARLHEAKVVGLWVG